MAADVGVGAAATLREDEEFRMRLSRPMFLFAPLTVTPLTLRSRHHSAYSIPSSTGTSFTGFSPTTDTKFSNARTPLLRQKRSRLGQKIFVLCHRLVFDEQLGQQENRTLLASERWGATGRFGLRTPIAVGTHAVTKICNNLLPRRPLGYECMRRDEAVGNVRDSKHMKIDSGLLRRTK